MLVGHLKPGTNWIPVGTPASSLDSWLVPACKEELDLNIRVEAGQLSASEEGGSMIQIILQILKSTQNLRSRDAPCGDAVEYSTVAHSEEKNLSDHNFTLENFGNSWRKIWLWSKEFKWDMFDVKLSLKVLLFIEIYYIQPDVTKLIIEINSNILTIDGVIIFHPEDCL